MIERRYFKTTSAPEITVAIVGISKHDWTSIDSIDSSTARAAEIMARKRFDVLPIGDGAATINTCYTTINWGRYTEDNIELREINSADRMYFLTNIRDAIRIFAISKRNYFFLDNHDEIVGLVTIGNLNCKHVYLYLYNQVAELEQALGAFIYRCKITDERIMQLFEERTESSNAKSALARYKEDDENGFDYKFIEYVFLTDLCYVIRKFGLLSRLDLTASQFEEMVGKINDVRTVVAHPNKSLIKNRESLEKLKITIDYIDVLINRLSHPSLP